MKISYLAYFNLVIELCFQYRLIRRAEVPLNPPIDQEVDAANENMKQVSIDAESVRNVTLTFG